VRKIILEGVWDHIVNNIHGNVTPYEMWKALTSLFQNCSDHRKLMLKDKLRNIKMQKNDTIQKYLIRFTKVRDELAQVGFTVSDDDLVSIPKIWHS